MKRIRLAKTFLSLLKKGKIIIPLCMVLIILSLSASVLSPRLFQLLLDDVIINRNFDEFTYIALGLVGVYLLRLIIDSLSLYCDNRLMNDFTLTVRKRIWHKYFCSPVYRFESNDAGELKLRMMDDVNNISIFVKEQIIDVIYNAGMLLICFALIVQINAVFALISIGTIPIVFAIDRKIASKIEKINEKIRTVQSGYYNSTFNAIRNNKEIKTQNAENVFVNRFNMFRDNLAELAMNNVRYWTYSDVFADFKANYVSKVIIYFIALLFVMNGTITLGTALMVAEYYGMIFTAADVINTRNVTLKVNSPCFSRVVEVLNSDELHDGNNQFCFNKSLSFNIRSFCYQSTDVVVISNVAFEVHKGDFYIICGKSGSGKTTLIKLLLNMYSSYDGSIMIDDIHSGDILTRELYKSIAIVEQNDIIFNMTIRDNMLLANPDVKDDEIIESFIKVGFYDAYQKFEYGLDTLYGEAGVSLSGGEKQLFCIARALASNPKIIIMDEATNALDKLSEDRVIDAIKSIPDITVIAMSHKPSMLERSNKKYYLKGNDMN